MSTRLRGAEAFIRISSSTLGVQLPHRGSFLYVRNFTLEERGEISETEHIGESTDSLDYMHHGWSGSYQVDEEDAAALDYMLLIAGRDRAHLQHPDVMIAVELAFRTIPTIGQRFTLTDCFMRSTSFSVPGRKEFIQNAFEFKARELVTTPAVFPGTLPF